MYGKEWAVVSHNHTPGLLFKVKSFSAGLPAKAGASRASALAAGVSLWHNRQRQATRLTTGVSSELLQENLNHDRAA
ncbi:hypothetical protein [Kamptonema formosum]|uniref:hypothetical protein n=1 Tax=Kamptonema formosum TaxID=331992 RepID=UPI0003805219|nr:hypothetical protein [Oscillatoria sp. PCC 10802]